MATTKTHRTRHHSNLRPKNRHTKKFLDVYHPFLPLMSVILIVLALLQPWVMLQNKGVLAYATDISSNSLLNETNQQRASYGRSTLEIDKNLTAAAQEKAQDMVVKNYWSHETPDGQQPWTFIVNSGYSYSKAGENLAYGFSDSEKTITGWMNSASHKANMLDDKYSQVGFGYANSPDFAGNGPTTVVVAMYGTPAEKTNEPANVASSRHVVASSSPKTIAKVQTITNGSLPWAPYLIGAVVGALLMYLLVKHSVEIKRSLKKGEKFVIKHPWIDASILVVVAVGVLLMQTAGNIL